MLEGDGEELFNIMELETEKDIVDILFYEKQVKDCLDRLGQIVLI